MTGASPHRASVNSNMASQNRHNNISPAQPPASANVNDKSNEPTTHTNASQVIMIHGTLNDEADNRRVRPIPRLSERRRHQRRVAGVVIPPLASDCPHERHPFALTQDIMQLVAEAESISLTPET